MGAQEARGGSRLNMVPPVEFEQVHYGALKAESQTVQERHKTWGVSEACPRALPSMFTLAR